MAWQMVDDEGVLLDLRQGRALGLNSAAAFVWARLATGTPDGIARDLGLEFDLDPATARRDVDAFVADLRQRGLLQAGSEGE